MCVNYRYLPSGRHVFMQKVNVLPHDAFHPARDVEQHVYYVHIHTISLVLICTADWMKNLNTHTFMFVFPKKHSAGWHTHRSNYDLATAPVQTTNQSLITAFSSELNASKQTVLDIHLTWVSQGRNLPDTNMWLNRKHERMNDSA